MRKLYVALIVIILLAGCTTQYSSQPQSSSTTTDGNVPSTEISTVTLPIETYDDISQGNLGNKGIYNVSDMIIQQDMFRLDCLYTESNVMLYSDIMAGQIMVVSYDHESLKPHQENAYTLPAEMYTKTYINDNYLYTIEYDYVTGEGIVKTYALLDGQLINTMAIKDTVGFTYAKDSILLFSSEENQQRVYKKNLIDGHEDTVLVWDISDKFSKPIISDIVDSENGFAFTGSIFTQDANQSVLCCGFIDLHGNLLELNIYNDEQRVSVCNGGILVQDEIKGFDSKYDPEGKYYFYELATMSIKEMDAQDPKCSMFFSPNGEYLVAACIEEDGFCFWVYDLIQGAYLKVVHYKATDIKVDQYNVSIDEDKNGLYLLLKSNTKTQLIYFEI